MAVCRYAAAAVAERIDNSSTITIGFSLFPRSLSLFSVLKLSLPLASSFHPLLMKLPFEEKRGGNSWHQNNRKTATRELFHLYNSDENFK